MTYFRIVTLIKNIEVSYESFWVTMTNKKQDYTNANCRHDGTISDDEIEQQLTFLWNKYYKSRNDYDEEGLEVLSKAADVLLYISFCYEQTSDFTFINNLIIGKEEKQQMIRDAVGNVHDLYFQNVVLANLSKLGEENRYYNWYHGYTNLKVPFWMDHNNALTHWIDTYATSGIIKTQYFGDQYDPGKIEKQLSYIIRIFPPYDSTATLTLEIERVFFSNCIDTMWMRVPSNYYINENVFVRTYTPPRQITIWIDRYCNQNEIDDNGSSNSPSHPGFQIKWSINKILKPDRYFTDDCCDWLNIAFKR